MLIKKFRESKNFIFPPHFQTSYLEHDLSKLKLETKPEVDPIKLENLIKRRKIYGDITQNVSEDELAKLLRYFDNHVPSIIIALEEKVRLKGSRTFVPPAFFGRDGIFVQPPTFEMPTASAHPVPVDDDKVQHQNMSVEHSLNIVTEKKTVEKTWELGVFVEGDKSKNV